MQKYLSSSIQLWVLIYWQEFKDKLLFFKKVTILKKQLTQGLASTVLITSALIFIDFDSNFAFAQELSRDSILNNDAIQFETNKLIGHTGTVVHQSSILTETYLIKQDKDVSTPGFSYGDPADHISYLKAVGNLNTSIGFCTATLIEQDLVLTAAHCVCRKEVDGSHTCDTRVTFNLVNVFPIDDPQTAFDESLTQRDISIPGDVVRVHPEFGVRGWLKEDFAIINLDQPVNQIAQNIIPIQIEQPHRIPKVGDTLTLVGFGRTGQGCSESGGQKLKLDIKVDEILSFQSPRGSELIFIDSTRYACPGDSGGPALNSNRRIVGVASTSDQSTNSKYSATHANYSFICKEPRPSWCKLIALQSDQNGKFVRAGVTQNTLLAAVSDQVHGWETFHLINLADGKVALQSDQNGKFVRAGVTQNTLLAAVSDQVHGWETFHLINLADGKVALQSDQNGKFVRAGVTQNTLLAAVSDQVHGWETFHLIRIGFPHCTPNANQITVFVHAKYTGDCSILDVGDYASSKLMSIMNDSVSSIKVGSNVSARLCQHADFGGRCQNFTRNQATLTGSYIGNDQVSSAQVFNNPIDCSPSDNQIAIFEHANYIGTCSTLAIGEYSSSVQLKISNDSVSSIKVGSNVSARLCQHADFGGRCQNFTRNQATLTGSYIGNDQVSSAQVFLSSLPLNYVYLPITLK